MRNKKRQKMNKEEKEREIERTFKSGDTEEWLDKVWTRRIGYAWAVFFRRLGVHPNTVTVLSMVIGAGSAFFFASGSWRYCGAQGLAMNIVAVLLLAWANFYDSADGQLARMTGQKTRLGRILDGAASEVWFIPIYCALVVRFYHHHAIEFSWLGLADNATTTWAATLLLFALVLYSGFVCHSGQCGLADYYRQIHLLIVNGKAGSELDTSAQQRKTYDATPWKGNRLWKFFLLNYIGYTAKQERRTPTFQKLRKAVTDRYGSLGNVPEGLRQEFRRGSLPIVAMANILTFNTRAIVLYALCLLDLPWAYFLFEVIVMSALCAYMNRRHERLCGEMLERITPGSPQEANIR